MKKPEEECSESLKALFCSLVGALAWLTQTRIEIAVYVTALQRWNKNPRIEHAKRANRVLAYCRRKETSFNLAGLRPKPPRQQLKRRICDIKPLQHVYSEDILLACPLRIHQVYPACVYGCGDCKRVAIGTCFCSLRKL